MNAEFERLAYETALRSLSRQEELLKELRSRMGVLLAASALAASFLADSALADGGPLALEIAALAAFVVSTVASLFVLMPRKELFFTQAGSALYEGLYEHKEDLAEVYRRLAYDLDRFWRHNDAQMQSLFGAFRVAGGALIAEILMLAALASDTLG